MNIFQVISAEWWIVTLLILAFAFFDGKLFKLEQRIARFVKRLLGR